MGVDRHTYERYQSCEDPELGPRLRDLVTINPAPSTDDTYARLEFSAFTCRFLEGGLCGIQTKLGEPYLPVLCATFPRVRNSLDGVRERTLDLACPEAARLALLDPAPMAFDGAEGPADEGRVGSLSRLTTDDPAPGKPYRYFHQIREFAIAILQYRAYPLWKRLIVLAAFCDRLEELAAGGRNEQVPAAVEWFHDAVRGNRLDAAMESSQPQTAALVELVLELVLARITAEYASPRFLQCVAEFKSGLEWTAESSMDDIGRRYAALGAGAYGDFLRGHQHMLEHYLVTYAHGTLFPLGPQDSQRGREAGTVREQGLTLLVYYSMVQALLTGMAGFHGAEFGAGQAIQVIQSVTKTVEHSSTFPAKALAILSAKGVRDCTGMAMLLRP